MIRIGMIGCGEHSEIGHAIPLARYCHAHPGEVELSAACDMRLDRARYYCKQFGFRSAYSSIDEMLAQESMNACIAVVPVGAISELGILLLERGIPCVIEKPLGSTMVEVAALREAEQRTRTPHMVSVNRRFMPFLTEALGWVEGTGKLRYVRATMARHARTEPEFLSTTAVHCVDALRYVAGEIADARITQLSEPKGTSWFAIDLQFENGVVGRIDVLPTAGIVEESYELIGEGFSATVRAPFGWERGLWCVQENELVLHRSGERVDEDVIFGFHHEALSLVESLAKGTKMGPSIADVSRSVEICFELEKQVQSRS